MTELGNELVNGILEAKVDSTNSKKPTPQSTRYNKLQLVRYYCKLSKIVIWKNAGEGTGRGGHNRAFMEVLLCTFICECQSSVTYQSHY